MATEISAITDQVEYYFSLENLMTDTFLLSRMNSRMMVPLRIIICFKRIRQLTSDMQCVVAAVRQSQGRLVVEREEDGEWWIGPYPQAAPRSGCTIVLRDVSPSATVEDIEDLSAVPLIHSYNFTDGTWYATYGNRRAAAVALYEMRGKTMAGRPVVAGLKDVPDPEPEAPPPCAVELPSPPTVAHAAPPAPLAVAGVAYPPAGDDALQGRTASALAAAAPVFVPPKPTGGERTTRPMGQGRGGRKLGRQAEASGPHAPPRPPANIAGFPLYMGAGGPQQEGTTTTATTATTATATATATAPEAPQEVPSPSPPPSPLPQRRGPSQPQPMHPPHGMWPMQMMMQNMMMAQAHMMAQRAMGMGFPNGNAPRRGPHHQHGHNHHGPSGGPGHPLAGAAVRDKSGPQDLRGAPLRMAGTGAATTSSSTDGANPTGRAPTSCPPPATAGTSNLSGWPVRPTASTPVAADAEKPSRPPAQVEATPVPAPAAAVASLNEAKFPSLGISAPSPAGAAPPPKSLGGWADITRAPKVVKPATPSPSPSAAGSATHTLSTAQAP